MHHTSEDDEFERREQAAVNDLRPLLTPEFLATLRRAAEVHGWNGDFNETARFVEELHRWAGVQEPTLQPREYGAPPT